MPEAAPYNESGGESGWGSCARLPSPPDQWRLQNAPRSLGQVGFISLTFPEAAVTCLWRGLALQTHLSLIHLRPSFVPESLPQRSQPLREPEIARPLSSTSWPSFSFFMPCQEARLQRGQGSWEEWSVGRCPHEKFTRSNQRLLCVPLRAPHPPGLLPRPLQAD